jgi:1-phosphofructokinase family hexose kinase
MILTVTLNPSVDHALFVGQLQLNDTNRVIRTERDAGGKGVNLARVVAELGQPALATGFLGGGAGAYVRKVLDRQGVHHCFVEVDGETRTNFSVEDETDAPPTTFNEPGPTITASDFAELVEQVQQLAPKVRWLSLGGSLPPGAPEDSFFRLAEIGHASGCFVALDADGEAMRQGLVGAPDLIKPNDNEASRLLDRPVETLDQAVDAAQELVKRLQRKADAHPIAGQRPVDQGRAEYVFCMPIAIVSRGGDGAVLACPGQVWEAKPPKVDVKSTIGSGDSMVAGVLWALEEGKPLEEAFRWGTACGAATATTDGSEIARRPVILELLEDVQVQRLR